MSRRSVLVTVGCSVVSAAAASVITTFYVKRRYDELYDETLRSELRKSIQFLVASGVDLSNVVISDDLDAPLVDEQGNPDELDISDRLDQIEEEVEQVEAALDEYERTESEVEEEKPAEPEVVRLFGQTNDKPSLEELRAQSQKTAYHKILTDENYTTESEELVEEEPPYEDPDITVISKDIFMENGSEFEQIAVTVFSDGGVLDGDGQLVVDHETLIGKPPYKFGEMSEDDGVVYIRNKRVEKEFEVIRDDGNATDFLAHSLHNMYPGHVT